jgi:hypothetical protein
MKPSPKTMKPRRQTPADRADQYWRRYIVAKNRPPSDMRMFIAGVRSERRRSAGLRKALWKLSQEADNCGQFYFSTAIRAALRGGKGRP